MLRPIDLLALTVNPVAPQSHSFDSATLRARLGEAIADLPVFDVLHPSYTGSAPPMPGVRQRHRLTADHRPHDDGAAQVDGRR